MTAQNSPAVSAPAQQIRDTEYGTQFAVPVTLRQVEAAGIELDGGFGIDASEHAGMLDEAGLLRIVFGIELTGESEVIETFDLETYESRNLNPADWHSCTRRYYSAAGSVDRNNYRQNRLRLEDLLRSTQPGYQATLDSARLPFDAWVAEMEQNALAEAAEQADDEAA